MVIMSVCLSNSNKVNNHMGNKRLILFDIDGTLVKTYGAGREATRLAMLEIFGTSTQVEKHRFGGKTDWLTLIELLRDEGHDEDSVEPYLEKYTEAAGRHIEAIIDDFPAESCPGSIDLVTELRTRASVCLGVVTGNVATTAPVKLRASGFDPAWFPVGAFGNEAVDRNDLPQIAIERANRHFGHTFTGSDVVVIGDTVADITCARAVGAVAVGVLTGFESPDALAAAQPDHLLTDLTTFLDQVAL